ncbi:MAG: zf-HC2 domain-containing protein [Actinobacteria bacterium]|nr:zf-HC2 domain-containing protein [Actinomycetota bacterium]
MKIFERMMRVPPDCREVADVLQAYLDGELPESKTHVVSEHLQHCERCGIEADVYLEVKRSLGELATPPDRDVMARLRSFADRLTSEGGS